MFYAKIRRRRQLYCLAGQILEDQKAIPQRGRTAAGSFEICVQLSGARRGNRICRTTGPPRCFMHRHGACNFYYTLRERTRMQTRARARAILSGPSFSSYRAYFLLFWIITQVQVGTKSRRTLRSTTGSNYHLKLAPLMTVFFATTLYSAHTPDPVSLRLRPPASFHPRHIVTKPSQVCSSTSVINVVSWRNYPRARVVTELFSEYYLKQTKHSVATEYFATSKQTWHH